MGSDRWCPQPRRPGESLNQPGGHFRPVGDFFSFEVSPGGIFLGNEDEPQTRPHELLLFWSAYGRHKQNLVSDPRWRHKRRHRPRRHKNGNKKALHNSLLCKALRQCDITEK